MPCSILALFDSGHHASCFYTITQNNSEQSAAAGAGKVKQLLPLIISHWMVLLSPGIADRALLKLDATSGCFIDVDMNLIFVLQPWLDLCGPEMIESSFIILIHKLPHLQLRGPVGGTPRIDLIASQASHSALYFFLGLRFSGQWMQSIAMSEFWQLNLEHELPTPPHQTNLSCRVLCHSMSCFNGAIAGTSCQVCGKWPSSRAINRQPCRYCPRPSLNVLAQSGVISPVAQNQRTLHHNILICYKQYVHLIWPFLIKYCNGWKMPNKRHVVNAVSWRSWLATVLLLLVYVTQILTCQLQAGS